MRVPLVRLFLGGAQSTEASSQNKIWTWNRQCGWDFKLIFLGFWRWRRQTKQSQYLKHRFFPCFCRFCGTLRGLCRQQALENEAYDRFEQYERKGSSGSGQLAVQDGDARPVGDSWREFTWNPIDWVFGHVWKMSFWFLGSRLNLGGVCGRECKNNEMRTLISNPRIRTHPALQMINRWGNHQHGHGSQQRCRSGPGLFVGREASLSAMAGRNGSKRCNLPSTSMAKSGDANGWPWTWPSQSLASCIWVSNVPCSISLVPPTENWRAPGSHAAPEKETWSDGKPEVSLNDLKLDGFRVPGVPRDVRSLLFLGGAPEMNRFLRRLGSGGMLNLGEKGPCWHVDFLNPQSIGSNSPRRSNRKVRLKHLSTIYIYIHM